MTDSYGYSGGTDPVTFEENGEDESLFEEAESIVTDRENVHGGIVETHEAIADYFAWYIKHRFGVELDVRPSDAANMLQGGLKGSRKVTGEMNRDTFRDSMGYDYCAWVCREWEEQQEDNE